jgi:hypothetical protein
MAESDDPRARRGDVVQGSHDSTGEVTFWMVIGRRTRSLLRFEGS